MPKYSLDWQNWTIIFGIQLMQQKSFKKDSKCCDISPFKHTLNHTSLQSTATNVAHSKDP